MIFTNYDTALPMGCSTSCSIFEYFSTAFEWIAMSQLRAYAVLHILDDFSFIAVTQERCARDFLGLCNYLGVPIATEKTILNIPVNKLQKCRNLLSEFLRKRSVTVRDL